MNRASAICRFCDLSARPYTLHESRTCRFTRDVAILTSARCAAARVPPVVTRRSLGHVCRMVATRFTSECRDRPDRESLVVLSRPWIGTRRSVGSEARVSTHVTGRKSVTTSWTRSSADIDSLSSSTGSSTCDRALNPFATTWSPTNSPNRNSRSAHRVHEDQTNGQNAGVPSL